MKLTTLLMILGCLHLNAAVFSQTINLSERNVSLEKVFSKIEAQTGYTFFYRMELISAMPNINISLKNVSVDEALDQFLGKLSLTYSIIDKTVVIKPLQIHYDVKQSAPTVFIGKVIDEKDRPMPGVSIRVKHTNLVFVTNQDGQFITSIIADPKAILQISYVGYENMEVPVSTLKNPIVFKLKMTISDLDQVQVIAYGTTTKRISTGNVTTIRASDIAKSPARNILEVIQGQVPGLFIKQLSGLPGSPFSLMIRGQQTISAGFRSSQPLIIVDGVALPSGVLPLNQNNATRENLNNNLKGGNPLDYIDPSIIESLTVLKDADATSIYGSRGAYGVILITTKKGRAGTPVLNISANSGVTLRGTAPDLLNTEEYIMLRKEGLKNDGTALGVVEDINGPNANRYTDFQKELTGNKGVVNRVNLNYSGGTKDITFLIGGNFRKQNTIQIGKGSVRDGGANFSISNNVKDNKFSITLSGSYLTTTDDAVPYDFSQGTSATSAPNAAPLFLPDGSLNWESDSNPASAMNIIFKNVTNNLFTNLAMKYEVVKGLSLNANVGYNGMNSRSVNALPSTYFRPGSAYRTTSTVNLYNLRNITVNPSISYQKKVGAKGTLTLTTGGTLQNELSYQNYFTGNDFLSDDMLYNPSFADALTPAGAVNITTFYNQIPNKRLNFIGIINYNWDNKYILNLNGNRDGSTKFGQDSRFGNFGSVGAAWIISSEKWFEGLSSIVSFAKVKGSIGTGGGDGIENYGYLTTFSRGSTYEGSLGLRADALANRDLHWEKNRKTEGGLSMEFLKGKFGLDVSYYDSKTTDQLAAQALPTITGFAGRQVNSPAVIKNWGWEFEFSSKNISAKHFTWTSRLNVTLPKNKLVAYPGLGTTILDVNYMVGKPVEGLRLYKYAGVDPETGLYNFINRNGVKGAYRIILDPVQLDTYLDKTEFVNLTPKFYGGLSNSFTYKGLSMDIFFTFTDRVGKTFLGSQSFPPGFVGTNLSKVALKRWQNPGDITEVQKAGAGLSAFAAQGNYVMSTGAYGRALYARLSNLNISYSLPAGLTKRLHVGGFSIFGQGANLLTISKYGDLDPENLGAGMAPLRNFTGGIRVTL